MNFEEAERFLYSLINYEYKPGYVSSLEPFKDFLKTIGNPQENIKNPILIVGTKGKGSTAALITAGLASKGYRVGLFTSPHLVDIRERIQINFNLIPEEKFASYVEAIKPFIKGDGVRTYFEVLTAIAFKYFSDENVDFAVFEAGLGGRLDATNVLNQIATAITPIDLDHTRILGDTVEKIAREKAAVIKNRAPVVTLQYHDEAVEIIRERAEEMRAPLLVLKLPKVTRIGLEGTEIECNSRVISSPLKGKFQAVNMTIACNLLDLLGIHGFNFRSVKLRGRFDVIQKGSNTVIVDSAHNEISLKSFFESYFELFKDKPVVLFGVSKDKAIDDMLGILSKNSKAIYLTGASVPRIMSPTRLEKIAESSGIHIPAIFERPCDGLQFLNENFINTKIVVIGSFYVAGDAYKCL